MTCCGAYCSEVCNCLAIDPAAPLRRCRDCELDLGDTVKAAFRCPRFGLPRANAHVRCLSFVPREASK